MRNLDRRSMWLLALAGAAACGDNITIPLGPALAHSDTLFLGAHNDDDFIFMEPELLHQLGGGASTTVYATTAGPNGVDRHLLDAATVAYGATVDSSDWECGEIEVATITAEHCRLRDRPVSIVDLGLSDGGIPGNGLNSLLHLFDGTVEKLPGYYGGSVDTDSVIDVFAALFAATTPDALETLELAASHGRDHSSHMFVGAIGLWAAARVGYSGPVNWNRGYNVEDDDPTLTGDELADARTILGYYEACADHCGPCGQPCPTVLESHETWLERQYSTLRVPSASGRLALGDQCLDAALALGDCATAPEVDLSPSGDLRLGDRCVTSAATDEVTLEACTGAPEQYWVLDSDGALWNGRPPSRAPDMTYDHVRCFAGQSAPTCGATFEARWQLVP